MLADFPFRFEYIPYPLWRRQFPFPVNLITRPLWPMIYPVREDRTPPADATAMTDYLVRYRLMPEYQMRSIYNGLRSSEAEIEHAVDLRPRPADQLPVRLPAQWEPMEAVMVNWPVMYPPLWELHAELVEAIAPVAQVMITFSAPMWGHAIWLYLTLRQRLGNHMEQVRFLHLPTNDIWVRDHGPLVGYNSSGGRVALNATYDHLPHYPQALDNSLPMRWATHTGTPLHPLNLHTEGGNLWTDGEGTLIMSQQIFNENPGYTYNKLEAYLHTLLDFKKLIITPQLHLEETGHVDLLGKLIKRDTILVSTPPASGENAAILTKMTELFRHETNALGERYTVIPLPTPKLYFNWFAYPIHRTYTNALTVNGRVLVPVYGIPEDKMALQVYREALPEYTIVPINCKAGVNGGGAVHCMTKEIPTLQP